MSYIPNRIVIGAIDTALNRIDNALHKEGDKTRPSVELMQSLRDERAAMVVARTFIAEKRA